MTEPITLRQFHESDGVEDWRVLADAEGNEVCVCTWRTGT